jgi:PAS domain S-box-containing protein
VSPRAIELYGYKTEDLIGRHLRTTTPARELPKALKVLKSVLSGKVISNFEINQLDVNGRIVPVEINATPVRKDGKIIALQGVMRDITQRKEAQDRIKRAAEEWRTTFDSITDLVSICDKDFRLVRVNKAFADILKKKPVELIGKPCHEMLHGTNEPVLNCPQNKTIKTKKPATAEFFEPHLGIHLEVSTFPIFNDKGEVVASVHVARDVTERKKMEGQLIVTDRLASIGELASGIAHELNNPLTGVIGFSDLLLDRDLPDDIKEDIEVINREAKRTAGVVRNLLTFARKHETEKKPVNINSIIEKVLELRAYEQKVNNIEVNTQFAPDLPEVIADGFQLQQVFINIIINAEHFMIEAHGRGMLNITTERVENTIKASFADDGPGIAKENLGHLFDPFFTTKEAGKGTGLGLSICHGIITEHGGRIYAKSELGKGATFVVELPVSK